MNVSVEKQENCQAVMKVSYDAAIVKSTRDQILRDYAKKANIPGFRPGKIPLSVIEKRLGDGLKEDVTKQLVNKAYGPAVQQEKLQIVNVVEVLPVYSETGDLEITYKLELQPSIKLPLYKGLKLNVNRHTATAEDVEKNLQAFRMKYAKYNDVERGAQKDDMITIDYKGTVDGQPMKDLQEEGNHYLAESENYPAAMEETSFLPGFYEQILGAKAGENRNITITMPEDAGNLSGKEVVYSVTVKKLQEPELPEVNDAFASSIMEGKTLEELREELKKRLEYNAANQQQQEIRVAAVEALRKVVEMDLPPTSIRNATERRANELVNANIRQGLDIDSIKTHQEEILEAAKTQAELDVKDEFILQEIARIENLGITNEELNYRIAVIAQMNQVDPKNYAKDLQKNDNAGLKDLHYQLLLEKAVSLVVEHANVTFNGDAPDAPTEAEAAEAEA